MTVLGLSGLLVVVGCSDNDESATETTAVASTTIDVSLTEFAINGDLTAPAGNVVLNVTNDGMEVHNLVRSVPLLRTPNLDPGETAVMDLGALAPGTYELKCDIRGHQTAGMVATLVVSEG